MSEITNFLREELFAVQRQDPLWFTVVYTLESGDESVLPKLHVILSQFSSVDGLLCHTVSVHEQTVTQLVIPTLFSSVLQHIHDAPQSSHPGRDKFLTMARKRYYWPTMSLDIINHAFLVHKLTVSLTQLLCLNILLLLVLLILLLWTFCNYLAVTKDLLMF